MLKLKNLINFEQGNVPIILSIPHGGTIECEKIPKRTNGITGIDKCTIEIGLQIISKIKTLSINKSSKQMTPSYIICQLRRSKIDLNRVENEAYMKNSQLAKEIYEFYHNKLQEFIRYNLESFNKSLLIDIHGFEKHKRPAGYRDVEIVLGTDNLKSLSTEPIPKREWDKTLRGELVSRFLDLGIEIAPGHPRRKEYVLTGGYIIRQYGASKILKSKAIQIEFSDSIRYKEKELKGKVISSIAELICDNIL